MSDKIRGTELPDGRIALSEEEISKLRIKIGKSHRTEKDWTVIKELFEDRVVFTANPSDIKMAKECCVDGVLKDEGALVVFTSVAACTDYLDRIGVHRFGRYGAPVIEIGHQRMEKHEETPTGKRGGYRGEASASLYRPRTEHRFCVLEGHGDAGGVRGSV